MKMKEFLYDFFVRKNGRVQYEYERYVREHIDEHYLHRLRHLRLLFQLNWFYRVKRGNTPYIYWDTPLVENKPEQKSKNIDKKTVITNNMKKNKIEPYLMGAESNLVINSSLGDPHHVAKRLINYDVISFDIFDTLIFRPFCKPTDLFILVGEKLGINDFKKIRIDAERKAREISWVLKGTREITFRDIYEQVERETGIPASKGMETELALEEKYCFANPYMKIIFDILVAQDCKIILTSDMYLTEKLVDQIIKKCGYEGYERIFVSCEYGCGKGGDGNLYKIIQNIYGNEKKFCHIGDNYQNDVLIARKNNWSALHYPNVHDVGNKYRATYSGMSELWGSMYGAIVNIKLHNGLKKYSEAYEYGYIYGGLYVFGFCNWIYNYVKENKVDKILFLSRDGYIYKRVFDLLFKDVDNEYVYWSRYPSIISCAESDRHDYLNRFIRHRLNDVEPMTLDTILHIAKIDFLIEKLPDYGLRADAIIQKEFIVKLENMIVDNWNLIIQSYQTEKAHIEKYIKVVIGDAKNIAVVDVGWLGSGPLTIKHIVEKIDKSINVDCLCAASYASQPSQNISLLMNGTIKCYLFNEFYNRNHKDYHLNTNQHCNNLFFEIFTQATSPSLETINFENNEMKFDFGLAEVENYEILKDMHLGIVEFAEDYHKHFGEEKWLCDVSGYDSYIPFRFLTRNISIIKRIFGKYVISRNIGYDTSKQQIETLNSVLEMRGL